MVLKLQLQCESAASSQGKQALNRALAFVRWNCLWKRQDKHLHSNPEAKRSKAAPVGLASQLKVCPSQHANGDIPVSSLKIVVNVKALCLQNALGLATEYLVLLGAHLDRGTAEVSRLHI